MVAEPEVFFIAQAERIAGLEPAFRAGVCGGYGSDGEVIYDSPPSGCPSVLMSTAGAASAVFMSNGSVAFTVCQDDGLEVEVLAGHFDSTEKRETGVPSNNLWFRQSSPGSGTASLITPLDGIGLSADRVRVFKSGDPDRSMWVVSDFSLGENFSFRAAVKFSLVLSSAGPALLRLTHIVNTGRERLNGELWSFFNLRGTQVFAYNKSIWYDAGIPVSPEDIVVSATVPYSDSVQPKCLSSHCSSGVTAIDASCDYSAFVGDSSCSARLPAAVREGGWRAGAGSRLNRFSAPTIAANRFALDLDCGAGACLLQQLLYVSEADICARFRARLSCPHTDYPRVEAAFREGAVKLFRESPSVTETLTKLAGGELKSVQPSFRFEPPKQPIIGHYAGSLWTGVSELYENCRAHGAKLAEGIELGTRDRAQDMWPMMKQSPERVRADLIHALSFMIVTVPDDHCWAQPLSRVEKLHGMFPRQYPSRWNDRSIAVMNDNRPYNDSAIWLVDALNLYIRETGDLDILSETVGTVSLTEPEFPEQSGLIGNEREYVVAELLVCIFDSYLRQALDSPYGMVQIMYGDWCDPIDMFGTLRVGDAATRGEGRGVQVRLSAHVFSTMVQTLDIFNSPRCRSLLPERLLDELPRLRDAADTLRLNIIRFAWEDGVDAGFVTAVHELRADGSRPDYERGELGYTLGSMRGSDFDGRKRREITAQAYGISVLQIKRDWLSPVADADARISAVLKTCDEKLFDPKLGFRLYDPVIANDAQSLRLVGRMGVLPAGCAENGEYHHGQMMMHRFRLLVPGEADNAWHQFLPIISALRDGDIGGPFEMPATSYAADVDDPHFGKGMYFGLSGSTDWIIEFFQDTAGIELSLHDDSRPIIRVTPRLPSFMEGALVLRRILHVAEPGGGYREVPFCLEISPAVSESSSALVLINGVESSSAEIFSLEGLDRLDIRIESNHDLSLSSIREGES